MKVRDCIEQLEPYGYVPGDEDIAQRYGLVTSEIKRFDRNTFQCALKAVERELKLIANDGKAMNEYPDSRYLELTALLAEYTDAENEQIVLGNGADEVIDIIAKAYIDPGDIAIVSTPTFSFYKVVVCAFGGTVVELPREKDFSVDAEKLIDVAKRNDARIIFLCNPNNPTANFTPVEEIEKIVQEVPGILVIDEAYLEFSGEKSATEFCSRYPNIIVIRTLSKAFGLAGMRIGYALCSLEVAKQLNKIRQPYCINAVSERLAIAALKNGMGEMKDKVGELMKERKRMAEQLEKMGFEVFPSRTNFLTLKTSENDSKGIFEKLIRKGIVLRNFGGELEGVLRITIRSKEDNDLLLKEMGRIYDGVIFDIDGVLVDVSASYREAIKQTMKIIAGKDVTDSDIEKIKKLPNSNNDWDVTYALIKDITDMKTIDRNAELYLAAKRKFQELYLGGLRDKERILVGLETLKRLKERGYKLGIVTSRPRDEALYVLRGLIPEFFSDDCIIAFEDCIDEKPSPKPLLLAKERMGCRTALYVGDTINDALTAKAAGMQFASVIPQLKGDFQIENVNKIFEVLK